MKNLIGLLAGMLFGAGLAIGGMTRPDKVLGFLDLAGRWDPSLAFVMGGGLLVAAPAFALARRRTRPLFDATFQIPTRQDIDKRLVAGALLFGVGWGIAGYCPGPAIAALSAAHPGTLLFCAAMLAGMGLQRLTDRQL
ncbi:MAG: YeeE/YedE family protein [Solimonas sp.]